MAKSESQDQSIVPQAEVQPGSFINLSLAEMAQLLDLDMVTARAMGKKNLLLQLQQLQSDRIETDGSTEDQKTTLHR